MIKVFISYSHADKLYKEQLEKHLAALRRSGEIEPWADTMISPSEAWNHSISKAMSEADIIICLISSDFINSDYCYEIEMKDALARHHENKAKVIPIIVRPCDWHDTPFAELQVLPTLGKPVKEWTDEDEAYLDSVEGIKKAIRALTHPPPVAAQNVEAARYQPPTTKAEQSATEKNAPGIPKFVATHTPSGYRKKKTLKTLVFVSIILLLLGGIFYEFNQKASANAAQNDSTTEVATTHGRDADQQGEEAKQQDEDVKQNEHLAQGKAMVVSFAKGHTTKEWLIILAIGALAGWIAGTIVNSDGGNIIFDVTVGIIGGYIGTRLFDMHLYLTGNLLANQIITATAGAILLAILIRILRQVVRR